LHCHKRQTDILKEHVSSAYDPEAAIKKQFFTNSPLVKDFQAAAANSLAF
jgi:hypothetical protein